MPDEIFSAAGLRRALVIKLRHHGDVLLAAPVLSMLQRVAQPHLIDRNWKKQSLWRQIAAEGRLLSQLRARWLFKCWPAVAIFGPSGDREWAPWRVTHRVVASTVHDCRPCGRAGCNDSKVSECLTTLPLAQVLAS